MVLNIQFTKYYVNRIAIEVRTRILTTSSLAEDCTGFCGKKGEKPAAKIELESACSLNDVRTREF
jgi:hypothetical protein